VLCATCGKALGCNLWRASGQLVFRASGADQEKFYFNLGDTGFKVFHTRYADIGVLICWDQVGGSGA
jgi:predicted amidohydrolase